MDNYIKHYGTPRESGRYPYGSGDEKYAKNRSFINDSEMLERKGMSQPEVANAFNMTLREYRAKKSNAKLLIKSHEADLAYKYKEKGMSNTAIAERLGRNEKYVRDLLKPTAIKKKQVHDNIKTVLEDAVDQYKYVDIGKGVENHLGISQTKLNNVVTEMMEKGYKRVYLKTQQLGTGKDTTLKVLVKDNIPYSEVFANRDAIKMPIGNKMLVDDGLSVLGIKPPTNVSSKRIAIKYAEDGGSTMDGVIELRRGVEDISLGKSKYAQVRIAVEGSHYLKGMAMYSDDLPDGIDIRFNTNKTKGTPMLGSKDNSVLKGLKDEPDNPFGAIVRQAEYVDSKGNKRLSALNIVTEEGEWGEWSKTISSQVLSKQNASLIKKQLDLAYANKKDDFDEITKLTNPVIKKKLLESAADDYDSAAVTLKAAALPRQGYHVILPFDNMSPTEIYAPNYKNGEKVVLIRYPHGGKFEIPELTVNNKHRSARNNLGNAKDAVGINSKVAEQLSGADFDGDTVLVIPNDNRYISTAPALKGLKGFDPKLSYPYREGVDVMSKQLKGKKMGDITNLITDMQIQGATNDEVARAVRHSMVVIDAEKHKLNYKQSYLDNAIKDLKIKYQGKHNAGASTIISRAKSEQRVMGVRNQIGHDPVTGAKRYIYKEESYVNKAGKKINRTTKSTKMAETNDASLLSSGTKVESYYAEYANKLKSLANQARLAAMSVEKLEYSPSANKRYSKEVENLDIKLKNAEKNAPLERQALLVSGVIFNQKKKDNPNMDADEIKKIKGQALTTARIRVGAKKPDINITDSEWEAIQAGAIHNSKAMAIINNADLDMIKQRATPRQAKTLSPTKRNRAIAMVNSGYTQEEIATQLGVSISMIKEFI